MIGVQSDGCHLRELDLCFASLASFARPSGIARNEADLDHQCSFLLETEECVEDYVDDCMPEVMQQLVDQFLSVVSELRVDLCSTNSSTNSSLRSNFLQYGECVSTMLQEGKPCFKDVSVAFDMVSSNETAAKDRIGLSCCATARLNTCMKEITLEKCGEETWNFMDDMKNRVTGRIMSIMCEDYTEEHELCLTLPEPGTPPAKRIKGRKMSILNRLMGAYGGI